MRVVRFIAMVLPIVIAAAGCSKEDEKRVSAPEPPDAAVPEVLEAQWITDPRALGSAVQAAAGNPLVQRAVVEAPHPRLTPMPEYALRAVGSAADGSRVGVTMLPYMVDQDSTHAVFISLLERDGRQLAEFSELIFGRAPTSLETGFSSIMIGNRVGWFRGGSTYLVGSDGSTKLSSGRFNWEKWTKCFMENAPAGCTAGRDIADDIAPGIPSAGVIGCSAGTVIVAIGCAIGFFR